MEQVSMTLWADQCTMNQWEEYDANDVILYLVIASCKLEKA